MDLKKLNDLLVPYKIEIICDSCTRKPAHTSRAPTDFPEPPKRPDVPQTDKKMNHKSPKTYRIYSHSKSQRQRTEAPRPPETSQTIRRPEPTQPPSFMGAIPSTIILSRQGGLINPPNHFLNLNPTSQEATRRMSIQELLESSRNTPHKIEDVDPERFLYSERKGGVTANQLAHTTAPQMLFCAEESPISIRGKSGRFRNDTPLDSRLALGAGPSRDTSPFRPIYNRGSETPSDLSQTPRQFLQFTPNIRGLDPNEDGPQESFNLLENPFEKAL
jgi:hypothetical protein